MLSLPAPPRHARPAVPAPPSSTCQSCFPVASATAAPARCLPPGTPSTTAPSARWWSHSQPRQAPRASAATRARKRAQSAHTHTPWRGAGVARRTRVRVCLLSCSPPSAGTHFNPPIPPSRHPTHPHGPPTRCTPLPPGRRRAGRRVVPLAARQHRAGRAPRGAQPPARVCGHAGPRRAGAQRGRHCRPCRRLVAAADRGPRARATLCGPKGRHLVSRGVDCDTEALNGRVTRSAQGRRSSSCTCMQATGDACLPRQPLAPRPVPSPRAATASSVAPLLGCCPHVPYPSA